MLRDGDSEQSIAGQVIWFIGRGGSGKSTLIAALQQRRASLIALDDHLRVRAGIRGKDQAAYDGMIGLAWSLAVQGFDVCVPCGGQTIELRNYIRAAVPSSRFVYIAKRGRPYANYEEPQPGENMLILLPELTIEQEVNIALEYLWKAPTPN